MEAVTEILADAITIIVVTLAFAGAFAVLLIWKKKTPSIKVKYDEIHDVIDDAVKKANDGIDRAKGYVKR